MAQITLELSGLTCGHCVAHVTEELTGLPTVEGVDIDLVSGGTSTARVQVSGEVSDEDLREAVDEAGNYQVLSIQR